MSKADYVLIDNYKKKLFKVTLGEGGYLKKWNFHKCLFQTKYVYVVRM